MAQDVASASKVAEYVYTPLQYQDSIRLLTLLPSDSKDAPIVCTICEYPSSQWKVENLYRALSYTWGPPTPRMPILVNGCRAWVTPNLYSGLQHLRARNERTVWWIDAICINQEDSIEQGNQVTHMREIYEKALFVVAWLGPSADDSDLAMSYISTHWVWNPETGKEEKFEDEEVSGIDPRLLQAVDALLSRPYWTRVWIIQELTCAALILFICGNCRVVNLAFDHFFWKHKNLRTTPNRLWWHERTRLLSVFYFEEVTLDMLVMVSRFAGATDPKDKVYALLGLIRSGHGLELKPDYTLSPCEVYWNAIETMLKDLKPGCNHYQTVLEVVLASQHCTFQKKDIQTQRHCDGNHCGSRTICVNLPFVSLLRDSSEDRIVELLTSYENEFIKTHYGLDSQHRSR